MSCWTNRRSSTAAVIRRPKISWFCKMGRVGRTGRWGRRASTTGNRRPKATAASPARRHSPIRTRSKCLSDRFPEQWMRRNCEECLRSLVLSTKSMCYVIRLRVRAKVRRFTLVVSDLFGVFSSKWCSSLESKSLGRTNNVMAVWSLSAVLFGYSVNDGGPTNVPIT